MATARIVDDAGALEALRPSWTRLAEDRGRAYCTPAWMLSWWANVAPEGARLRVILIEDGDELLGVVPLFVHRWHGGLDTYRFLGCETSMRLAGLFDRDGVEDSTPALREALSRLDPAAGVLTIEGAEVEGPSIVDLLPDDPWVHEDVRMPAPIVELDADGYDAWLSKKSSNFRQQMRRSRRQLEADGATFRRSGPEDADGDIDTFARLHLDRWEGRGGSAALKPGVVQMLKQVASTEIASGHMRIFNVDLGGRTISTQIFMCAGNEYAYWLGGFDDAHAAGRPGLLAILQGVEDAHAGGFRRVDLGPGDDSYKFRLTDRQEDLAWMTVVARGRGFWGRRARLAPHFARVALRERLSDDMKLKINKLLRRS